MSGNDQQPSEVGSGEPHTVFHAQSTFSSVVLCSVSHLQGRVDLVSDVLDDVALHARVPTEFQHVPLKKMARKANKPYVRGDTSVELFIHISLSLLEKTVLGFDIKLINAHLEHFQTPGPLLKEK